MTLTLAAVSLNDQPLSQPITAVFDARGGTIGRADHNTMALPDPQRHVSRLHAEIVAHGTGYIIRNVGAANPIIVNGRSLAHGETAALNQAEHVRIGGYLLKVMLDDGTVPSHRPNGWVGDAPGATVAAPLTPLPAPSAPPHLQARASLAPPEPPAPLRPASPDPFADLLGPATSTGSDHPFADLLGPAPPTPPRSAATPADPFADLLPPPAGVAARSAALQPTASPAARLPDDFDPFALAAAPSVSAPARAAAPASTAADPFADLMPAATGSSIDAMFGLGAAASSDPLAHFLDGTSPAGAASSSAAPGLPTDPLALFERTASAPAAPLQMAQADDVPALHSAFALPQVAPTATPDAAASSLRESSSAGPPAATPCLEAAQPLREENHPPAAQPLRAVDPFIAFCAGAGIDATALSAASGTPEQRMHELGRIVRAAVEGTLQLIAVRTSTKHELRAGITVIQQRNNNPLKFSPDAAAALTQLLQPPLRGFLDGPAAMDDAMHDLVGHSIGTVAGLRAAVEGMLDRFAPQALEAKLTGHSVLDNLLPAHRKARLWDLYLQHHAAIRDEAQEDFHTLFGKAFLAAYEQQVERLQRQAAQR